MQLGLFRFDDLIPFQTLRRNFVRKLLLLFEYLSSTVLCLLIVQIKSIIDELSECHILGVLHHALLSICAVNLEHFGNEATDMVVGQNIELIWRENICQETEDLEEDEFILNGFLIVYLLMRVGVHAAQTKDTFIDACVSVLLRLVLEFNHVCLNILLDIHVSLLLCVEEIANHTIITNTLTMDPGKR